MKNTVFLHKIDIYIYIYNYVCLIFSQHGYMYLSEIRPHADWSTNMDVSKTPTGSITSHFFILKMAAEVHPKV